MSNEEPHEKLSPDYIGRLPLQAQRRFGLDTGYLDNDKRKQAAEEALKEVSGLLKEAVGIKQNETGMLNPKRNELLEKIKTEFKNNGIDLSLTVPVGRDKFAFVQGKWVAYLPPTSDIPTWQNIEAMLVSLCTAIYINILKGRAIRAEHEQKEQDRLPYKPEETLKAVVGVAPGVASVYSLIQESIKYVLANAALF